MSRSLLHDWEPSIENLSVEMNKIAEDIYNTAYARGKNHPDEVLYKIRAEIKQLRNFRAENYDLEQHCDYFDARIIFRDDVLQIIDKYMIESEERDYEEEK